MFNQQRLRILAAGDARSYKHTTQTHQEGRERRTTRRDDTCRLHLPARAALALACLPHRQHKHWEIRQRINLHFKFDCLGFRAFISFFEALIKQLLASRLR